MTVAVASDRGSGVDGDFADDDRNVTSGVDRAFVKRKKEETAASQCCGSQRGKHNSEEVSSTLWDDHEVLLDTASLAVAGCTRESFETDLGFFGAKDALGNFSCSRCRRSCVLDRRIFHCYCLGWYNSVKMTWHWRWRGCDFYTASMAVASFALAPGLAMRMIGPRCC